MSDGPYFDDLSVGDAFDTAPAMTLTAGRIAVHQSIIGSRLRLSLDEGLSRAVAGSALADPAFVWDTAIGQSTLVTRRVIANLFYRGLAFHRFPAVGDTLRTRTEVVGLRQTASRPAGLAALRITTHDQHDRLVLDFWRCAMLPLSAPGVRTGYADDLDQVGAPVDISSLGAVVADWSLAAASPTVLAQPGDQWQIGSGDVVSSAPELARLSLNLAHVHHDAAGRPDGRLVYGGHTIGLALAQVTRVLPDLITVLGWHGCDHNGPVREGDTLVSDISVEAAEPFTHGWRALTLRVKAFAIRDGRRDPVLDWRPIVLAH